MAKKSKQKVKKGSKNLNSGRNMTINKQQYQLVQDESVELRRQVIELKQQIRMLYLALVLLILLIITLLYMFYTCIMQQAKCYENVGEFLKGDYLQSLLGNGQILYDLSGKVL